MSQDADDGAVAFQAQCQNILNEWIKGDLAFRNALARLNGLLKLAQAEGNVLHQAIAQRMHGFIQGYRGNVGACIEHYMQARRLYEQLYRPYDVVVMNLNLGIAYRHQGDFNEALDLFRSTFDQAEVLGEMDLCAKTLTNEALLLITMGRLHQANLTVEKVALLAQEHYDPQKPNWPTIICEMYYAQALVDVAEDRPANGWQAAIASLEIAKQTGQSLHRGYANRTLALVLDALDKSPNPEIPFEPDTYYFQAEKAFREMRAEAELAHTMYLHGVSRGRRGQSTEASRKFQQALVIFSRLGMVHEAAETARAQSRFA